MIEINGVQYTEKQRPQNRVSRKAQGIALMAAAFAAFDSYNSADYKRPRQAPNVDIVSEYKLIQDKKSKLCRYDRDWVEQIFHNNFIKAKPLEKWIQKK